MHRSSARHRRSSSSMSCARRGGGPCSLIFGSGGRWCIVVCGGGGLNSGAAGVLYISGSDGDYMASDGTLRLMSRLVDVLEERVCLRGEQEVSNAQIDADIQEWRYRIDAMDREIKGWSKPWSVTERNTKVQYDALIQGIRARIKELEGRKKKT